MERYFNTEGICKANIHYMVNIDERLRQIKKLLIERGKYFVINRGRQYGKTTTLRTLADYLKEDYIVVFLDFQRLSTTNFENEQRFVSAFSKIFMNTITIQLDEKQKQKLQELSNLSSNDKFDMNELFIQLSKIVK